MERKYILAKMYEGDSPFPVFYLLMKVHKESLSTRPIISCSGSILHPIAIWADRELQVIALLQHAYLKSSRDLKEILVQQVFPTESLLFTADAVSMYTNIDTPAALRTLETHQ